MGKLKGVQNIDVEEVKKSPTVVEQPTQSATKPLNVEKRKKHSRVGYGQFSNYVCIRKRDGTVLRLLRNEAAKQVANGAEYVSRTVWRKEVRDI